jgi:hypothetical protein
MRKKMALSVVTIAMAMLLSFGVALNQANADSILFPWIVKSNAISTLISVVNTASVDPLLPPFVGTAQTHWSYFYKDDGNGGVNNSQTASCQDLNFKMTTSAMDVVTVDAAGNIHGGMPMFGDLNNILSGGVSAALSAPGDRRAFLIVDNNTPYLTVQNWNADGTLYGEAMVLELASGAAWGYVAYNSGGPFGDDGGNNPMIGLGFPDGQNGFVSFSNGLDVHGEALGEFWTFIPPAPPFPALQGINISRELAPVTLMPPSAIDTKFFMTPVDMINAAITLGNNPTQFANRGQRFGNINTRLGVCAVPARCGGPSLPACAIPCGSVSGICLTGRCDTPGITLNDEAPLSSTKLKNIVCTSADDISALLDVGTMVTWNANGGQAWTYMNTEMGTQLPATSYQYSSNMVVGKLEWNDGPTIIDGSGVSGTFNNFIQVRNNKDNLMTGPNSVQFGINNLVQTP